MIEANAMFYGWAFNGNREFGCKTRSRNQWVILESCGRERNGFV
jgi:hypothetical protein